MGVAGRHVRCGARERLGQGVPTALLPSCLLWQPNTRTVGCPLQPCSGAGSAEPSTAAAAASRELFNGASTMEEVGGSGAGVGAHA